METTTSITTQEGYTFTLRLTNLPGISTSLVLTDFSSPDDIDYWRKYNNNFTKNIATNLLTQTTVLKLHAATTGIYQSSNIDETIGPLTMNSNWSPKLHRIINDRENKIDRTFNYLFDPDQYLSEYRMNGGGSGVATMNSILSVNISFDYPYEYNAKSLPASWRIHPKAFPRGALQFIPRNQDNFCILHCIFAEDYTEKSLNRDEEYMERFEGWFDHHNLSRFYSGGKFVLDNIDQLEKELGVNINLYTCDNGFELFYRSEYLHNDEKIFNLAIVPMEFFYSRHKTPTKLPKKTSPVISLTGGDGNFIAQLNVKEFLSTPNAHCCLIDPDVAFGPRCKTSGERDRRYSTCRFCTAACAGDAALNQHEHDCKLSFQGVSSSMRCRKYLELQDNKMTFKNYFAFYRLPFCTYDFETRLDDEGQHVPFSYSILYFNVFQPERSKVVLRKEMDPKKLVHKFLSDLLAMTKHNHELQSVEEYHPEGDIPLICPWCQTTPEDPFEWNHSHFDGDNLNLDHNRYICHKCNMAATIKNKPLKFFAHNNAKFDLNLILKALINDQRFKNFEFLAKSESRFSQVAFCSTEDVRHKISLNDSLMILTGGLADLSRAWVKEQDKPKLKTLLSLFYPNNPNNIDPLVAISGGKQVFPYAALSREDLHQEAQPLPEEIFFDTLRNEAISPADYNLYLGANTTLETFIGEDYSFLDYHDFYLQLDVILLAMCLFNFSQVCFRENKIWPLAYLSISSYSLASIFNHNKYSGDEVSTVVIPKVNEQKWLQGAIKGGFTHVFRKHATCGDRDEIFYSDVNSEYPSAATGLLPCEFLEWVEPQTLEEGLGFLEAQGEDRYCFLECDIEALAPQYQDRASRYPLFPENVEIQSEWLSADQHLRYEANGGKAFVPHAINTVTFFEKKNYRVAWNYVKFARQYGYKVSAIHRIAVFKADYVMKAYITKLYELKKQASITKDNLECAPVRTVEIKQEIDSLDAAIVSYKLILNGSFGSTITNQDRHSDTELHDLEDDKTIRKRISGTSFKSLLALDNKVLINRHKRTYQLSYPLMLGAAILWESKLIIAKLVYTMYDWLKAQDVVFDALMTDTDSYMWFIPECKKVFKSFGEFAYRFNTECYPAFDTTYSPPEYQQPETHQALFLMKDERRGHRILEFNGVAAKFYCFTRDDEKNVVKGKGILSWVQKKVLNTELYRNVINGNVLRDYFIEEIVGEKKVTKVNPKYRCSFGTINSKHTVLSNAIVNKAIISLVDIKAYYPKDSMDDYAIFGGTKHLALIEGENEEQEN